MAATSTTTIQMSDYFNNLTGPARVRYQQKVNIMGLDPYTLKKSDFSEDLSLLPSVDYPDIANYLVFQTSWATGDQMRNWKAMESYNFFVSGWVNTLQFKVIDTIKVLVYARVNHSQRARETPLKSWVLAEKDGVVLTGHCDCMAGLEECCSHVGAVLWATWTTSRMYGACTCTDVGNRWLLPAYVKDIPYLPVSDMDFTSAKKKKELLLEKQVTPTATRELPPQRPTNNTTSPEEQAEFFRMIAQSNSKPAILSLVTPFSDLFVPKSTEMPKPLTQKFYNENYVCLDYDSLVVKHDSACSITVTEEQCKAIEMNTRKQSASPVWYNQRSGRITASKLKAVCHTKPNKPSVSLVNSICYPESNNFSTAATTWGINNEPKARSKYIEEFSEAHEHFTVAESGLHVYQALPFLGASPGGMVNCKCCGVGVCEIKCPYRYRNFEPETPAGTKDYCLVWDGNRVSLDRGHAYYYQIQAQIFICNVDYCDFIVWTSKGMYVERILPDKESWEAAVKKAEAFFKSVIFPELSGRWFTRPGVPHNEVDLSSSDDESGQWCYCQRYIEDSELIKCDNESCKIIWFHTKCVHLTAAPEVEWLCPDCFISK